MHTIMDNPRHQDNLGIMLCFHRKYLLGDPNIFRPRDFTGFDAVYVYLAREYRAKFLMPLYLLDHSIITMSVNDFHDRWDSGRVGCIYTTSPRIRARWGHAKLSSIADAVKAVLVREVEAYDRYLRGYEGESNDT